MSIDSLCMDGWTKYKRVSLMDGCLERKESGPDWWIEGRIM